MRCKPGDLAVIVRSNAGNYGLVLTVIRLATAKEIIGFGYSAPSSPVWITDALVKDVSGKLDPLVNDLCLRPIRDNPGNESFFKAAPLSAPSQPQQTEPHTNTNRSPAEV